MACLSVTAVACDRPDPAANIPRVPMATITGAGVIKGRVIFNGPPPVEKLLRNEPCCPGAPPTQRDETVTVNANGTLADVFVYIEGAPFAEGSALPHPVLDQVFCRYTPHVVGVVVGQTLDIRSSDPTVHNVQVRPAHAPAQNFWMKENQIANIAFPATEFIRSTCDVHPWMSATIGVFDNSFFAITDSSGAFNITGLPKGKYTLVAWHELYGRLEQAVVIADDTPIVLDFTYQPPKS